MNHLLSSYPCSHFARLKLGIFSCLEIRIKGIEITISAIDCCKVKIMVPKLCENGKL